MQTGDVIVKFDGKDIKELRELPRLVASMPVGREVQVVIVRKGQEITKTVTLGRLEAGEKQAEVAKADENAAAPNATTIAKSLGMEFSPLGDEARKNLQDPGLASRACW